MNDAEVFIDNIVRGRNKGSESCNRMRNVYSRLKKEHKITSSYAEFSAIIKLVGDLIWKKIYEGYSVAVPYLFNMEIIQNNIKWTKSVNWKRTFDFWKEDADAFNNRVLIRNIPTRMLLKVRHSTICRNRRMWYYPLLFEIRPSKQKVKDIETKYEL